MRVDEETHRRLLTLADTTGRPMETILGEAVAAYEAEIFWTSFEAGFAANSGDSERWEAITAERSGEAPALSDGLGLR